MLVVLVNGLPGSGKTTLAKGLANALGLPLLSKDRIKETLADTLGVTAPPGLTARQWSQRLGATAGETLWALLADTRCGAVLESPWLAKMRPIVVAGLQKADATVVQEVWCDIPAPLARRRYEKRSADRHPIHHDSQVDDQQWKEWARQARPLALGPVHRVNTTEVVDIAELAERIRRRAMTNASGGGARVDHQGPAQHAVAMLEWLLEHDVNALLRVDAERGGARSWTFHASGGGQSQEGWVVRADAGSAEECVHRARKALKAHGLDLPD